MYTYMYSLLNLCVMVAPALLGVPKLRSVNVFFFFFVCLFGCPLRPFCVFFFSGCIFLHIRL
eukprot:NODE_6094_length_471_cov_29.016588_g4600_i0.p2 GENE.NODE_6094_length_471_cov_29.016588_g4600_i0~~NODE_6094_length_471_cov_29.016588_g4600_i0.p2  ORF type:complete len:71 (+),score=18.46 NODE_6094_length_471_cov_29.016588_g4600_i0:28-213(+)